MANKEPLPFNRRLDSWKEIAAYLGKNERTVQRWEKAEGLPVQRHQHAARGSVYAYTLELEAWRRQRTSLLSATPVEAIDIGSVKQAPAPIVAEGAGTETGAGPVATPASQVLKPPTVARGNRRLFAWITLAAFGVLLVPVLIRIAPNLKTEYRTRLLTSFPGYETDPELSPDGRMVAFAWNGPTSSRYHIYVKRLDSDTPVRLTDNQASDVSPAWSPDGAQIVFLRYLDNTDVGIYSVPLSGGPEHFWGKLAGEVSSVSAAMRIDWSPDGKYFALAELPNSSARRSIVLLSTETGRRRQISFPAIDFSGDSHPAFSPDGKWVAFRRGESVSVEDIYIVSVNGGEPRRITNDHRGTVGHAWTSDGKSLVVASRRAGSYASLWRFGINGGKPERVTGAGIAVEHPTISRRGKLLAYVSILNDRNIWRVATSGGPAAQIVASTVIDTSPQYSPDGEHIAFRSDRNGYDEIWICDRDGGHPDRITNFQGPLTGSPRWAPDSKRLAFDSRPRQNAEIFIVDIKEKSPRQFTTGSGNKAVPSWSADGQWVYFGSNQTGGWQVWKQSLGGGAPVQLSIHGGFAPFESPDHAFVYFARNTSIAGLARVPIAGGAEETVLDALPAAMWGNWAVRPEGIYYIGATTPKAPLLFFDLHSRQTREISRLSGRPSVGDSGLAVAPDSKDLLFTQVDAEGSDLALLEGFH